MDLKYLAWIGEITRIPGMIEAAVKLGEAVVQAAHPGTDSGVRWFYGDGGRVGLSAWDIAKAAGVNLEEIVSASVYNPDLNRGLLFIGYPWDVYTGEAKESREEYDTTPCVDIEGVARVLLEIDPDKVPQERKATFDELINLAFALKELAK